MHKKSVIIFVFLFVVQALSAGLAVVPQESSTDTWQGPVLESGARSVGVLTDSQQQSMLYNQSYNGSNDNDGDGVVDSLDSDDDNDCIPDTNDSSPYDFDGDGINDESDIDDDGDGLNDSLEVSDTNSSTNIYDADNDGNHDCAFFSTGNYSGGNNSGGNNSGGNNSDGNNSGGNNSGGNNTSTGCGYDVNYTSVYTYSPYMVIENQSFSTTIYVNCEVYNSSMDLAYWIYDSSNYTVYSGNQSWTSMNNYSNFNWSVPGLSIGNYTFHAQLYVGGSYHDSSSSGIVVYANNSGGGGNTGNTGCGYDLNYTYINAYSPYMVMENQSFMTSMYIGCELIGVNNWIEYYIWDSSNTTFANGNQSWTGTMNGSSYNWSIAGLPVGNYTLQVSLYSNGTFASSDSDPIMVYANNSGGGGNTGNTGCGYDLNHTFINVNVPYMTVENQSFMTSVYVNCEIFNTNMLLTYVIYDANNYTVSFGNHSWTGMNNYSHWNWSIGGLSAGNYTFDAELYTNGTFVASNYGGIMVYANNSGGGGNNSGNQTSPCGNDPTYASVTAAQSWFYEYNIGDNFSGYISTNCALLQESMLLDWNIRNLDTNMSVDNGTFIWTAMNLYETHNVTSAALSSAPTGNYSFEATFSWYNNSSFGWEILSTNCPSCVDMFVITNSSSGGGGNNGGNNTLNDAHCLVLQNFTMSQSYYVSVNLVNTCNDAINYPGINATTSDSQIVGFSNSWWYVIDGNNSIPMNWQLYFDPNLTNGTVVDLDIEATVLNCGPNNSWGNQCPNSTESSLSLQFTFIGNTNTNNTGGNGTGNNTGGNGTGNNTGGNGTGNNTGGNNTGGNNTGGNGTGNNTGGNTGGNNTGGNNTGGNTTITPNNSPVVSNVSISPVITTVDDTLTCNYNVYDADGDTTVTTVTWSVNGNVILTGSDSISTGYGVGDDVSCGVSATDGQQPSATVSDSTVILPSPDSDSASSEGLPAIGTIGTMAAIAAGVFASRRKDE